MEADELKPVAAALAEAIMEQVQGSPAARVSCNSSIAEAVPEPAAGSPVSTSVCDNAPLKRSDEEGTTEVSFHFSRQKAGDSFFSASCFVVTPFRHHT